MFSGCHESSRRAQSQNVSYEGCAASRNMLLMIGQDLLEWLWDQVYKVEENNWFEAAIKEGG